MISQTIEQYILKSNKISNKGLKSTKKNSFRSLFIRLKQKTGARVGGALQRAQARIRGNGHIESDLIERVDCISLNPKNTRNYVHQCHSFLVDLKINKTH